MKITMTKAAALAKQAEQIAWYANIWNMPVHEVAARVEAETTADALQDGIEYPIVEINQHIPRGAAIEFMFNRYQGAYNVTIRGRSSTLHGRRMPLARTASTSRQHAAARTNKPICRDTLA